MAALDGFEQGVVARAREALAESRAMSITAASDTDLCREIGRLQQTVAALLDVIDGEAGQ